MALTPFMTRLMMSPFVAAAPINSFHYSARLNTKATPTDNATSSRSSDTTSTRNTEPTSHFWTADAPAGSDVSDTSRGSKANAMKADPTSIDGVTADNVSGSGDTSIGSMNTATSNSGDPTVPSTMGDATSRDAPPQRTPRGHSMSPSDEKASQTGSGDFAKRTAESNSEKSNEEMSDTQGDDTSVKVGEMTSRAGDAARKMASQTRDTISGEEDSSSTIGDITSKIGEGARNAASKIGETTRSGLNSLRGTNSAASSWNPFSDYDNDFAEFFRNPFGMLGSYGPGTTHGQHTMRNFPKVDIVEEGEQLRIFADLPGLEKTDFQVRMEGNNTLRISGKRDCEIEEEDDDHHYRRYERSCGRFSRHIRMPENVDKGSIEASFKNGVLCIQLKKTPTEDKRGTAVEIK